MPTEHPDARHLRCFVAAAEAESLRAAARQLGLAQATVTEHIRTLESIIGFRVFDRAGRSIALTERGELLLPRAKEAVLAIEGVAEGIGDAIDSGTGRLAVGAIPTVSPYVLPRALSRLRDEFPECSIVVLEDLTENLLDRLDDHTIELGIMSTPITHPRASVEVLGSEQMVIVSPDNQDAPSEFISMSTLRAHPRVSLSTMHCLGGQVESFCERNDLHKQVSCNATQLETVFELVRLGLGLSVVPEMAAANHPSEGLRFQKIRSRPPSREISVVSKIGRSRSMLAERLVQILRDAM